MPIYDYECECGNNCEAITGINVMARCEKCGREMRRVFHSRYGINMGVGAYGYFDENLGKYIGTNQKRREECRRQGVTPKYGKGWV